MHKLNHIFLYGLIVSIIFVSCQRATVNPLSGMPAFIKEKIEKIKSAPVTNPASSIWEVEYDGKKAYYIPPICCDIYSELYDSNGILICHPDGGITGKGDGKCTGTITKDKSKLIWQDDRK